MELHFVDIMDGDKTTKGQTRKRQGKHSASPLFQCVNKNKEGVESRILGHPHLVSGRKQ